MNRDPSWQRVELSKPSMYVVHSCPSPTAFPAALSRQTRALVSWCVISDLAPDGTFKRHHYSQLGGKDSGASYLAESYDKKQIDGKASLARGASRNRGF